MQSKKQESQKTEQEPAKKIVRDVYIPEFITVKELANRMTEKIWRFDKVSNENGYDGDHQRDS